MSETKLDMTTGKIFPKLVRFALPLMASAFLQLLFNAADMIVVSWYAGSKSLAAVGSTSSLINLLVNFVLGLSVGANVVAATYIGAKKIEHLKKTVHTAILLSFFAGIFLTFVGIFFSDDILSLMYPSENQDGGEILSLSTLYLKCYFSGITFTVIYNFGSSLLRAKGDTKRPLYILMVAGILNVILNLVFVIGLKDYIEGVAGVGLATCISQLFACCWVLIILKREKDEFHLNFKDLRIYKSIVSKIIRVGLPAGIQSALFSFSNVIIQSTVNAFGPIFIAANSACQTIEGFVYISMNCIAQACLTFIGQNMGAQRIDRIKKVFKTGIFSVIIIGAFMGTLSLLFADQLLGIMHLSPVEVDAAKQRLFIIGITYFTCGLMDVVANSIRGMGYSFFPMIATLIGACGLRIIYLFTIFKLPTIYSYQNIFWSYPISWIITFVTLFIGFRVITKTTKKN